MVDIALDPLEGTTICAKNLPNSLAVIAIAEQGSLLNAPDSYMDKIAIGPGYSAGTVDLDASPRDNIHALARAKGLPVSEITAGAIPETTSLKPSCESSAADHAMAPV